MNVDLTEEEQNYLIRVLEQNYAGVDADYTMSRCSSLENPIKWQIYNKMAKYKPNLITEIKLAEINSRTNKLSRKYSGYLNMGCGSHSIIHLYHLHKRLQTVSFILSEQQQNGGQGTEFNKDLDKKCQEDLKNLIKDFLIAFGLSAEELIEPKFEFDI